MARLDSTKHREHRENKSKDQDEFYESIAVPTRPYYDQQTMREYSPVEQIVSIVAGILNLLLALRFVMALFTSDTANPFVATLFGATDWLVMPFQALFGSTPPSTGMGFFDLPALAAIVAVSLIAWIINMFARGSQTTPQV